MVFIFFNNLLKRMLIVIINILLLFIIETCCLYFTHKETSSISFAFLKPLYASDFDGVAPPPELGETLTNYRTAKQLQDKSRVKQSNKKNTNHKNLANKKFKNTKISNKKMLNQTEHKLDYVPNRMVIVYSRGESVLKFVDKNNGQLLQIDKVELSSKKGFKVELCDDDYAVCIIPNGSVFNANIRVKLQNSAKKVMFFSLRYSSGKYEIRNIYNVKI
jgi:hypothetical protein